MKIVSKAISAIAAAALVAGAITVLMGSTGSVSANAPLNSGKGDRLEVRADAPKCSDQAWPNYDASCLTGRAPDAAPKLVRVITAADDVSKLPAKIKSAPTDVSAAKKAKPAVR